MMIDEVFTHPIIFSEAVKLDGNNTWVQHIPFAFFLISYMKPKTIVELGVHTGESYFAFCQAVKHLGLDAKCYGIDTWEGDAHTGFYGDGIFKSLLNYQDENYKDFSMLMRMRFDQAVCNFKDKSIDVLHIDGYHTYEAVKHDFEKWLPKLKDFGAVLFHDTIVKEREFGVWKFWEELSNKYPSVNFKFGFGLGCIVNDIESGSELAKMLERIHCDTDTQILFEKLGSRNLLIGEILRLKYKLLEKEKFL